jgi:hypothetical protein
LPTHDHLVAAANLLSSRLPKNDSGQQRAKYIIPTIPKTSRGLKIWFETIVPARVSSVKPTNAASEVPFMS